MRYATAPVVLAIALATPLAAQFAPEVRGRAVDLTTGVGMAGVEVRFETGEHAVTDADGGFTLRALEPGTVTLRARRIGYAPVEQTVTLVNGVVTTVRLELVPVAAMLPLLEVRAGPQEPGTTMFDRVALDASVARDLGDLLGREPELVITRRGGPGAPATISIRGSSANQVLVLVDGVPINDPLTGEADLSTLVPGELERVTVVRGAATARYGPGAVGGVIIAERRRPTRTEIEGSLDAASWGERGIGVRTATVTGVQPRIRAATMMDWRHVDGDFTHARPVERGGGIARRRNADLERWAFGAVAAADGRTSGGQLRIDLLDQRRGMPGAIVQPSLHARQALRRVDASAEGHAELGPWQLSGTAATQWQTLRFQDSMPPFGAPFDRNSRVRALVGTAQAAGRIGGLDLSMGGELRELRVRDTSLAAEAPERTRVGSIWAAARWPALHWGGGGIELGAGARLDGGTLVDGAVVSPRLQIGLRQDHWVLHLTWGRAFTPPSLADLFFQEGVQVRPNPALAPEQVRGEVTASLVLPRTRIGWLEADVTVSGHRADVDGMILWTPDFRFVWRPDNFNVRRRGGEGSLRLAARGLPLTLTAGAAWTHVTYTGAVFEGQVIYRPRWNGSAQLRAQALGTAAELAWRHVDTRRTVIGTDLNRLPAFSTTDLRLHRRVRIGSSDIDVRLALENLFDRQAAMLFDFPLPGRTWRIGTAIRAPR